MPALLLILLLALAPPAGAGAGPAAPPHDLHLTSGNAVVEGEFILLRIRFFKNDLEAALGEHVGASALALADTPEVDGVFLSYLADHLSIEVEGTRLTPSVLARGEDVLDREPVWWYAVEYRGSAPIRGLLMRNTLLFERFDDQRNVVKFVHFPEESQQTFAFSRGEEEFVVSFSRTTG